MIGASGHNRLQSANPTQSGTANAYSWQAVPPGEMFTGWVGGLPAAPEAIAYIFVGNQPVTAAEFVVQNFGPAQLIGIFPGPGPYGPLQLFSGEVLSVVVVTSASVLPVAACWTVAVDPEGQGDFLPPLPVPLLPYDTAGNLLVDVAVLSQPSAIPGLKTVNVAANVGANATATAIAGVAGKKITVYGYDVSQQPAMGSGAGIYGVAMQGATSTTAIGNAAIQTATAVGLVTNKLGPLWVPGGLPPLATGEALVFSAGGNTGTTFVDGFIAFTQA